MVNDGFEQKNHEEINQKEQSSESRIFGFNWYPGHIAKAERQLREKISLIDLVIELADARIPRTSTHVDLEEWAGKKPVVRVFSKTDLSDPNRKLPGIKIDSKARKNINQVIKAIEEAAAPINEHFKKKGLVNRPFKVMIVGYPNVGKSSLINALAKKKKTKVENKPGVTRSQQWVDIKKDSKANNINIKLLDTPGIIPTKFKDDDHALKLAMCSCVSDKTFDQVEVARAGLRLIDSQYPGLLQEFMKIDSLELENIAENFYKFDLERAAEQFINDFRTQRFGKISLE